MYQYPLPRRHADVSIWIELSTRDELPPERRGKRCPTMADAMRQQPLLRIQDAWEMPYTDLLKAFPDLDPENTYVTLHIQLHPAYPWPPFS